MDKPVQSNVRKSVASRIPFLLAVFVIMFVWNEDALSQSKSLPSRIEVQLPLFGFIRDPEVRELVQDIYAERLSGTLNLDAERKPALHLEIFVAAGLIVEGRFVPPPEVLLNPSHLSSFEGLEFWNEGCQIRIRHLPETDDFIVLVTDGSLVPSPKKIELCFLTAVTFALGENIGELPVMSKEELFFLIDQILKHEK